MSREVSVSELNRLVAQSLSQSPELSGLSVKGEVSSPKRYASGHFYFTLKDATASVSCVMFARDVVKLSQLPKEGEVFLCSGQVTLYERDGRYQLIVRQMKSEGSGSLLEQLEALKKHYQKLGYFDSNSKREIPFFPRRIGVVTSSSGAVIHDILTVLRRRFPGFKLQLISAQVQGVGAAASIARGVDLFNRLHAADVLIVGRGGGSLEDLWCFNDPLVVEAVHRSTIPVISAVGHEVDWTLCDFVADRRAPTPSAAAEMVLPLKSDWLESLRQSKMTLCQGTTRRIQQEKTILHRLTSRLALSARYRLERESLRLDTLRTRPVLESTRQSFKPQKDRLNQAKVRLFSIIRLELKDQNKRLEQLSKLNQLLSPWSILEKGYAAVLDTNSRPVTSVKQFQPGDALLIQWRDGQAQTSVNTVIENH